jgi:hypothetical protein
VAGIHQQVKLRVKTYGSLFANGGVLDVSTTSGLTLPDGYQIVLPPVDNNGETHAIVTLGLQIIPTSMLNHQLMMLVSLHFFAFL